MFHSFFTSLVRSSRGTYPSFQILSVLFCGQPEQQRPQFCTFSFFVDYMIRLYVKVPLEFMSFLLKDQCWVVHILFVRMVKTSISCTAPGGPPCPLSRVISYILSVVICCICLLSDWSFRLYHHTSYVCHFVASYLFSLWYYWFLWRCFVLLLGETLFLS